MSKLLISGPTVTNINSYLGNINPSSIVYRSLIFDPSYDLIDPSYNQGIIGSVTYNSNGTNYIQSNYIPGSYSGYFPTLDPSSNELAIFDLFDNSGNSFYQVLDPSLNITYENTYYGVNKVMNIGPNIIMLMEP